LVQVTEPLDANPQTYPSKEFILSRENLNQYSKSFKETNHSRSMKEISPNVQY